MQARFARDPPQRRCTAPRRGSPGRSRTTPGQIGASAPALRGREEFRAVLDGRVQHGGLYGDAPARAVRLAQSAAAISRRRWLRREAAIRQLWSFRIRCFTTAAAPTSRGSGAADPVSKIAWHSWVEVHPETAARWGVATGDFCVKSAFGVRSSRRGSRPRCDPDVLAVPRADTAYGRYAKDRSRMPSS